MFLSRCFQELKLFIVLALATSCWLTCSMALASEKISTADIPAIAAEDLKEDVPQEPKQTTDETLKGLANIDDPTPQIEDAAEADALRITPDKPEIIRLDRDALNVIVGSNEHLRVVPDTNRILVMIPKKPGSTFVKALDINGAVIMQRHVIIAAPKKNYVRVRRSCINGDENCREFSVYYCPDMCHEVSVTQDATSPSVPSQTASLVDSGSTASPLAQASLPEPTP
jgi:hypothetical protein